MARKIKIRERWKREGRHALTAKNKGWKGFGMEERSVLVDGRKLTYVLEYKKVKNLNLRIHPDGRIRVSAPGYVEGERIDRFVRSHGNKILSVLEQWEERRIRQEENRARGEGNFWYLGRLMKVEIRNGSRPDGQIVGDKAVLWMRQPDSASERRRAEEALRDRLCRSVFAASLEANVRRIQEELERMGAEERVECPALRMRTMKSRWGSCMPGKGIVTLNKRLIKMPMECVDYVVIHELCHLLQADHSPRFYAWMKRFLPDWRERKARLEEWARQTEGME